MKKSETKLLKKFRSLPEEAQRSVIHFCDFLSSQHPVTSSDIPQPKDIARPSSESVVLAMRRLSKTYFMLDNDNILTEASALMSQHILQGRDVIEVIDELETLFEKYYDELMAATKVDVNDDRNDSHA
ncbi:hypothetical protein MNBD_GAMMA23-2348 [hydrothermal vent metagenome]|uniref:Crp/Fnr family transcriptional regulator n=1 Tax=hydrothermal vent metagenome TaxID=652676 RepID=A0A3B1ALA9_9ZZZZ